MFLIFIQFYHWTFDNVNHLNIEGLLVEFALLFIKTIENVRMLSVNSLMLLVFDLDLSDSLFSIALQNGIQNFN